MHHSALQCNALVTGPQWLKHDPKWPRMTDYAQGWHTRGQGGTRGSGGRQGAPGGARGDWATPNAKIRHACSSQILCWSKSTKITTNTETAMLSRYLPIHLSKFVSSLACCLLVIGRVESRAGWTSQVFCINTSIWMLLFNVLPFRQLTGDISSYQHLNLNASSYCASSECALYWTHYLHHLNNTFSKVQH